MLKQDSAHAKKGINNGLTHYTKLDPGIFLPFPLNMNYQLQACMDWYKEPGKFHEYRVNFSGYMFQLRLVDNLILGLVVSIKPSVSLFHYIYFGSLQCRDLCNILILWNDGLLMAQLLAFVMFKFTPENNPFMVPYPLVNCFKLL